MDGMTRFPKRGVSPRLGGSPPITPSTTGYPWVDGDILYAEDLNEAIAGRSAISVAVYGAIGDGATHPLSSIVSFQGSNTSGWSLAEWQTIFPFATALTNELDHCAVMAAIIAAATAGNAVFIPAGVYRAAETLPVTVPAAGPLVVFGDGSGATRCASYGAFDWFNLTTLPASSANTSVSFRGLSVYQASNVLGGQGIAITGPVGGNGRPTISLDHCVVGNIAGGATNGTVGAYTVGANFQNCGFGYANDCSFAGSISGAGATQGVGIRVNGNTTFPSFGPIVTASVFYNLRIGVQAGDGVAAYVQGMQIDACAIVYCDYGAHWLLGSSTYDNDGLMISGGTTLQCVVACVLSDGVQVHNITGNYFLGMPNCLMIHMQNTHNINAFLHVSGNSFLGFGYAGCAAVQIETAGTTSQQSYHLTGNSFISFNYAPIVLASGSRHVTVTGNTFSDCVAATDAGTNVWFNNVSLAGGTTTSAMVMYQQGPPGTAVPANHGHIVWTASAAGATYFDPVPNSGQGALRFTSHVSLDGLVTLDAPFGNWGTNNAGKQLLITATGSSNNPAIAITDGTGANLIGIINNGGQLRIDAMPAYSNSTTAPIPLLFLGTAGNVCQVPMQFNAAVSFSPLPVNAANDAAAAAAGVAVGAIYRNGSVVQVRVA